MRERWKVYVVNYVQSKSSDISCIELYLLIKSYYRIKENTCIKSASRKLETSVTVNFSKLKVVQQRTLAVQFKLTIS